MKYIDADKLKAEIERLKGELMYGSCSALIQVETNCKKEAYNEILSYIDSPQQEQPNDLASLISEATTVAKRIVDRDSFYNSLPQNLRNKYTFNAWCEILGALSMMKEQEQPEVDLEAEIQMQWDSFNHNLVEYGDEQEEVVWLNWNSFKDVCRDLYELGKTARKKESK